MVILVLAIVLPIIFCKKAADDDKKKQDEAKEKQDELDKLDEDPEVDDEDDPQTSDEGIISMHTDASKRLVDGIVAAQMNDPNLEDDSGDHTTSDDTGLEDFNNDTSTGAAQLIAHIIHAIDDVDVPATDATESFVKEVLRDNDTNTSSALNSAADMAADASTMDSVDPSTGSSSYAPASRDGAYDNEDVDDVDDDNED